MRSAIIKNGVVVNVIAGEIPGSVECGPEVGKGWNYDGSTFASPPAPPEPDPTSQDVNEERKRRLEVGATITVTGYGDIPVQGRDQGQITILALEASAKSMKDAGITTASIPFRDRDNGNHMLAPDQVIELTSKVKQYAQQVYVASWTLKDMAEVPEDYRDDKWWP